MLRNCFRQFVHKFYYVIDAFYKTQTVYSKNNNKNKVNSLSTCCDNKAASG